MQICPTFPHRSTMPSINTRQSSPSMEQLTYRYADTDGKNTWRNAYRALSIMMLTTVLGLAVAIFCKIPSEDPVSVVTTALMPLTLLVKGIQEKVVEVLEVESKIYRQSVLETPLQLSAMQTSIMQSLSALSYQISLETNGTNCGVPIHDQAFAGGINTPLFSGNFTSASQLHVGKYLEHLNFIPAPTTGRGCTRIPSFSLSTSHWCYTHNVILAGCQDHSASHQYLSLGTLKISPSNRIYLSTLRSINLDDGINRKSCSIAATKYGCDMLCSIVTESEVQDYASPNPTEMIHGRLDFGGVYKEASVGASSVFKDWAANYPGVGSGVAYKGKVVFPVYGGVKSGTPTYKANEGKYAIYTRVGDPCPDSNQTQINNAKASYIIPYFSNRMVQQGILSIEERPELGVGPTLHVASNDVALMGAESRVLEIDGRLFLYQRGTSWFPAAVIYPVEDKNGTLSLKPPYIYNNFTRPGTGVCSSYSRCPNVCLSGVYTDAYPIVFSASKAPLGVFGTYLDHRFDRKGPKSAVFFRTGMSNVTNVSTPPVGAAYTTSTCFRLTSLGKHYCISIAEIRNTVFGEFRIVPLLLEVFTKPSK
uniref:Hemagglutinin-neuraminidase n=1 Tax=Avulavirus sp. TaxID=2493083 RepID=A0A481XWU2_9MONO|nr:HN [Avulavirus sp.]